MGRENATLQCSIEEEMLLLQCSLGRENAKLQCSIEEEMLLLQCFIGRENQVALFHRERNVVAAMFGGDRKSNVLVLSKC